MLHSSLASQAPIDLADVSLFSGLDAQAWAELRSVAHRFSIAAGGALFHQGATASAVYLVLEGQLKLMQLGDDGQAVTLRLIPPGEPAGLVAAVQEGNYPATAIALGPCSGVRLAGVALRSLMGAHPRIALNALPIILGRLHTAQEKFRELATERVERRLARALLRLARQAGRRIEGGVEIGLSLTRQDLAEMTGTTLYTVSRLLSRWDQEGLIASGSGKRLLIRAPHALVSIAEDLPPGR